MNPRWMLRLPLRKRCHLCDVREGLAPCNVCGKLTCQVHQAGGTCHECLAKSTLKGPGARTSPAEKRKSDADGLLTKIKSRADPMMVLADLYLILGGRPGSHRSTTLMGSLHLDQGKHTLMFDRQVARMINATTFARISSPGLGEVETRPYMENPTRRLAHDVILRTLDLISISQGSSGIQIIGGDPLLETVVLNEEMACPNCGSWREVCLCRDKPRGTMPAQEYFVRMMVNRLNQKKIGLRMGGGGKDNYLRSRLSSWESALDTVTGRS